MAAKVIPFPTRRVRETAAYALALSIRWQRWKGVPWVPPPGHRPERLGNLLQVLITKQPALVFAIENLVAEMVAQIES